MIIFCRWKEPLLTAFGSSLQILIQSPHPQNLKNTPPKI